jgi:hypothetical protein
VRERSVRVRGSRGLSAEYSADTDLLLDITTFFEGPESDQFGKWWTDLTPDKRLEMMKKARELILTDSVVMMMLNQAEKTGKEFDSMVHKTFTIFAPELFAENVFSSDHAALAFLLRAVMDGQEHEYFNEDIGEEAAAGGDADAQAAAVGPKKRESLKAGMKAGPETEVMSEMDGMRKVYRSVLLSSFLQKLVLTFKANF